MDQNCNKYFIYNLWSFACQGLRFEVVPSWFKETLNKELFKEPHEYAVETARQKALEVARRMPVVSMTTSVYNKQNYTS